MNERETKNLNVGKHVVLVHTYVTGRELRNIESSMMDKLELSQKDGSQEVTGFKGSMLAERQDTQIKVVVMSIDGKTENIVDAVLDLPSTESEEIINYVKELTEPKKKDDDNAKPLPTT